MQPRQIRAFVTDYLDATHCQIIETTPDHLTVKLSPEADRALTNRPYYWGFVERTGAEPETMSYSFLFKEETSDSTASDLTTTGHVATGQHAAPPSNREALLHIPPIKRVQQKPVTFGSAMLELMFQDAKKQGKFVLLYEQPPVSLMMGSQPYTSWLGVNFKVEWVCDRKRSELISLGISLSTGEITSDFHARLIKRKLTPKLPTRTHVKETISLPRAVRDLEQHLIRYVAEGDHTWAEEAQIRLAEELARIDDYYTEALKTEDPGEQTEIERQHVLKREEIRWQHKPKIQIFAINCGIFHLLT